MAARVTLDINVLREIEAEVNVARNQIARALCTASAVARNGGELRYSRHLR